MMELLTNTLVSEDQFAVDGEPPVLCERRRCPSGWYKLVITMDPLTVSDGSYVHLERDDDRETVPMMSRRSLLVYSSRSFQLTFTPPRPKAGSGYTIYSISLVPVDSQELVREFEACLYGDRHKAARLAQLSHDEDRWDALKGFIADDVFDCAELGLQIQHPRDFTWEGEGFITSHSFGPCFLVGKKHTSTISGMVRCKIEGNSLSALLQPTLYLSDKHGAFADEMGIRFPAMIEHSVTEHLIHLVRGATIRVNPVTSPGTAQISAIRLERSSILRLVRKTAASFLAGGYREIPAIARESVFPGASNGQRPGRRGLISKFWLLYRRLNRALSSRELPAQPGQQDVREWLDAFQPTTAVLTNYAASVKGFRLATRFSLICTPATISAQWLGPLVQSILDQVYGNWELLITDSGEDVFQERPPAADPRIRYVKSDQNRGLAASLNAALEQANGDYLLVVNADGVLEKHALYKYAVAVQNEASDFLYSDEVMTGDDPGDVIDVTTRPAFSIDYYLSHPYFEHLVCVRREIARQAGFFDESLQLGLDVDFNVRCLELAKVITHVPDYLSRWRYEANAGAAAKQRPGTSTVGVIDSHLSRTGRDATVRETQHPNVFEVRDRVDDAVKVAVIIPTKNNQHLLQKAVDSCLQEGGDVNIEIFIVDHESDDDSTRRYLARLESESTATIIRYTGPFNFSAINNLAVSTLPDSVTHYLFLNNDVESKTGGWIESLAATCSRPDVGACGAMLLYPDNAIQHGGVTVGMFGAAEHSYKSEAYFDEQGKPSAGHAGALVSCRDGMAVTAAVMMVRADVFHEAGGYDERLQVGFNDTDLCLKIFQRGYKVLINANVVLYHFESATRDTSASDPHPEDTQRFKDRHRNWIERKDPFFGAQLSLTTTARLFDSDARSQFARPRSIVQPNGCYGKRYVKL